MNTLTKPLLAALALAAIAYASQAQEEPGARCRSADTAACGADTQPPWMNVEPTASGAAPGQRAAHEAAATARRARGPSGGSAAAAAVRAQPTAAVAAARRTPGTDNAQAFETEANAAPGWHSYALALAALGVVGLMARRRFHP